MSYRNDHDAALSRIEALERELAEARDQAAVRAARDDSKIGMLQRELADVRRHGETRTPPQRPPSQPPKPPRAVPSDAFVAIDTAPVGGSGPRVSRVLLAVFLANLLAVCFGALMLLRGSSAPSPKQSCTINTWQRDVHVVGFDPLERDLGMAPVELTMREWSKYTRIELRAPGYDTLKLPSPASPNGCSAHRWELFRR